MHLQPRHGVLLVAAIAVLAFNLSLPTGWTESSPLPWDEAGHFLGATDIHDGLIHGDATALRRGILDADQYPPGHSLVLGAWMAAFGNHVASWLSFGLVVYVLTAILLARLHVAAGLFFVGLGMFGGLAPSLMVEPLAVLWTVLALSLLPPSLESRGDWIRIGVAWLATLFALMTKYNFGLPLAAALVIASLVRWDRRMIAVSWIGAGAVLGAGALFLSLQDQGWEMFRAFAQNRANSADASPIGRLGWYLGAFRNQWLGSPALGLGLLAAVVVAIHGSLRGGRDPRSVAAAALALGTLATFAMHPYLLGRNLVILVAAVAVLVGAGLRSVAWRGASLPVNVAVVLIALLTIPSANARRTALVNAYYPESAWDLQPVSRAIEDALRDRGFVRVVGTFNEFSAGWVRLLHARSHAHTTLTIDAPFPLERSRESLDAGWDPAYAEIVESWTRDGTAQVVGIGSIPAVRSMTPATSDGAHGSRISSRRWKNPTDSSGRARTRSMSA